MELQDWLAIMGIASAQALVVLLLLLVVQLRGSQRVARQAVRTRHMAAWRDANLRSTLNAPLAGKIQRAGENVTDDIDGDDLMIWVHDVLAFLIQAQSDFDAWREGVLSDADFDCLVRQRVSFRLSIHPRLAVSWSRYRRMFKSEFAGFLDELISEVSESQGRLRDGAASDIPGDSQVVRTLGAADWIAQARQASATSAS